MLEEETEKPNMARRDTAACLAFPGDLDPSPRHSLLKMKIEAIEVEEEYEEEEEDEEKEEDDKKEEEGNVKVGQVEHAQKKTDKEGDDGVISKKNVETNIRYENWKMLNFVIFACSK